MEARTVRECSASQGIPFPDESISAVRWSIQRLVRRARARPRRTRLRSLQRKSGPPNWEIQRLPDQAIWAVRRLIQRLLKASSWNRMNNASPAVDRRMAVRLAAVGGDLLRFYLSLHFGQDGGGVVANGGQKIDARRR